MRFKVLVLAMLFAGSPALGAGWYVADPQEDPAATTLEGALEITPTPGRNIAYFLYTSADATTSTGPVLKTNACVAGLQFTFYDNGGTTGVKIHETYKARGTTGAAITDMPQISADFDGNGSVDADALDCSDIDHCGLSWVSAADGIVPIITDACDSGTCMLKAQCMGPRS
jgi:hypothetical protein